MAATTTTTKVLMVVLALAVMVELSTATTRTIQWKLQKYPAVTYKYGDFVRFMFPRQHDVVEVTKAGYAACSGGVIKSYNSGSLISLKSRGTRYFVCQPHCSAGMKITINVA